MKLCFNGIIDHCKPLKCPPLMEIVVHCEPPESTSQLKSHAPPIEVKIVRDCSSRSLVLHNEASYCTTELVVMKNKEIHTFDRGFDDDGNRVWGPTGMTL